MSQLKDYLLSLKKRKGLLIIVTAAILIELVSAAQYYYTYKMMERHLEKRAENELTFKAILIKNSLNATEDVLKYHLWDIRSNLYHPDSVYKSVERLVTVSRYVHPLMFKSVRIIIAGAEALRPELATAFRLKFGKEIYEGYGCTETAPVASVNTENTLFDDYTTLQVNNKPGTVGPALPGTQFLIVDPETNEPLPTGEAGMILIGGCQVMKGYLKDEDRTKSVIVQKDGIRYYRTGDKGYLDEDGFLTIVDRYSRFAKLGGEMISLGAVEKKIQDTPVLQGCDYVVTAIPDATKGEKIVLLYQGEKDPKDVLSELRASGMPPLMLPSVAFNVDVMPKLGSGKADFVTAKKMAKELVEKK